MQPDEPPTTTVDARGLDCPQPVVLTRRALLETGVGCVQVLVDSEVSVENITRMARSEGCAVAVEQSSQGFCLTLTRGAAGKAAKAEDPVAARDAPRAAPRVAVLVSSSLLGVGDEPLGRILMRAFIKTLAEVEPRPQQAVFLNSGVRLTTTGSELIEDLRALERQGMEIISCGTCLDYYGLRGALEVGIVSNMYEIASVLVNADRVVRP